MRVIAKTLAWFSGVLFLLIGLWFVANRLLDEPLSPQAAALLASADDSIPDTRNVAVGILGLSAPGNSDFIAHGTQIKALYASNAPRGQIQEMMRGPKSLRPTVDGEQVNCWVDPDWTSFKGCLPFEKAPAVLEENKELLARYKALYGLGQYAASDIYYNDAFLLLVRLAIAEMHVDLRNGKHEAAYRKWRQQLHFVRGNLRGTDTWVGKASGLVAIGLTLPFLDNLLVADPHIVKSHATELFELVRPEGIAAFAPDGIARAEFRLLAKALEHPPVPHPEYGTDRLHWLAYHLAQKNRILNRLAAFSSDYAVSLHLPWDNMEKDMTRLREKYASLSNRDFLLDPFGSLFLAEYVESQLRARQLVKQMHFVDRRLRLATLLVRLINENVRDANIPRFLASADPKFFDPLTGNPAQWDPKDRKIYFTDSEDKCIVDTWFRVRETGRVRKPSSSVVNMNAC